MMTGVDFYYGLLVWMGQCASHIGIIWICMIPFSSQLV